MSSESLFDIATRACIKNIKRINDVGEMSYKLARPILLKIESPEHLYKLECQSPQLIGVDAELWRNFIKRDVASFLSKPNEPADPKNWYKVYLKLKRESENDMSKGEEQLLASLNKIQEEKRSNVAEIKDWKKMPRIPRMASDNTFQNPRIPQKLIRRPAPPSELTPPKTKTSSLMEKIKKEARNRPPQESIEEQKAKVEKILAERKKSSTSPDNKQPPTRTIRSLVRPSSINEREMQNREARLRSIAAAKPKQLSPSANHVKLTSNDFDDEIELKAATVKEQAKASPSHSPEVLAADGTTIIPARARVSPTIMTTPVRAPRKLSLALDGAVRSRTISPPSRTATPTIAPAPRLMKRKAAVSIFMAPQKRVKRPPMPLGRA